MRFQKSLATAVVGIAGAIALTAIPTVAVAQDSPLSFNVGLFSDYRYRGISQTRERAAVQAGVDYALPGGFYLGGWASNIQWIKDAGGKADAEIDLYGGWKGEVGSGVTLDVGLLAYQYPGHDLAVSPNTTEIYGAATFGPATLKYSHSLTNLFGFANSKNSGYLDLTATFDVMGFGVAPHIGYQRVAGTGNGDFSYTDYSLTVSKDVSGFVLSAAIVGTETKNIAGVPAYTNLVSGKNMGRTGLVVGVKKTFSF
jgi:uncharacterized protein (TIGR02001 family)